MTFAAAHSRLVTIVKAATPAIVARGLPAQYRHDRKAGDDLVKGDTRLFWLEVVSGQMQHVVHPSVPRRVHTTMELCIWYRGDVEHAAWLDAMMSDYDVVTRAVLLQPSWSGDIHSVSANNLDAMTPFTIDYVDGGAVLKIELDVEFFTSL